jgi:hypothetical protein
MAAIYLRQTGQRRQAFRANPRKQAAQDRFAKAFDKLAELSDDDLT